ncbi:MAG: hypothetical protein EAZ11_01055 [Curvibacter sp.]|nr:MAG: hypothetical protein EAZ11_01055 [Curvibacter sp.]
MSVIKSFAHYAHQTLSPFAPRTFKRSHVYELMAAGLGFSSWAALHPSHVLFDAEAADMPPKFARNILGRAMQLGCLQSEAQVLADHFLKLYEQLPFSSLSLKEVDAKLFGLGAVTNDQSSSEDLDFEDEEVWPVEDEPTKRAFPHTSKLLISDLEERANNGDLLSHYRLAKLLVCKVPTDYLYQESLRGRILNATEQRMVENYLALSAQHTRYLKHLLAAADGGIRAATLDYSTVSGNVEYRLRAEQMDGDVDPRLMAASASDWVTRREWLWRLVDLGDTSALEKLAAEGDQDAAHELTTQEVAKAVAGDISFLRGFAEEALRDGDVVASWKWQFVALSHGLDLTESTLHAFHDGGPQDGDFYDSDFGGSMYVNGDEGLEMPEISEEQLKVARGMAEQLLAEASD